MGMYDYYEPVPPIKCKHCGETIGSWQGKDGPNALFVWRQGEIAPVTQLTSEDCKLPIEKLKNWRLPAEFNFFPTHAGCRCCPCYAIGYTDQNGVWTRTEIIEHTE
jgi:hypothetical protein